MTSVDMKTHIIRLAEDTDFHPIIDFLKREWNPQHIYVKNPNFFRYEHCIDGRINALIAIEKETGELHGVMLMYPLQRELNGCDIFGGLWKVSSACKTPMLGYKMVQSVKELTGVKGHSGVGINPSTAGVIFRRIKEQHVGCLKHYYLTYGCREYRIADIPDNIRSHPTAGKAKFKMLETPEQFKTSFNLDQYRSCPNFKDFWYIKKRYFEHPIYKYIAFGIQLDTKIRGVFIAREISLFGNKILRIADFFGDDYSISECGDAFHELILNNFYEYVDFYEYGISDSYLLKAGFILKDESNTIIPNYFEPYIKKNIELWFHTPYQNTKIFKGDGDQDRPNMISGAGETP